MNLARLPRVATWEQAAAISGAALQRPIDTAFKAHGGSVHSTNRVRWVVLQRPAHPSPL